MDNIENENEQPTTFAALGLPQPLLEAIERCGYDAPTPIQLLAVPPALSGRDLLGAAQTGTGKTAAFVWPMLVHLSKTTQRKQPRAMVLTPTRELAVQVYESITRYRGGMNIKPAVIVGGLESKWQQVELKAGCDVVVATPGRLIEHVLQHHVTLEHVDFVVLDEADLMLDMGFYADTRKLLRAVKAQRQTLFFSATLHKEVEEWAGSVLDDPVRVEAAPAGTLVNTVNELHYRVKPTAKPHLLRAMLLDAPDQKALVFVARRAMADALCALLTDAGISAGEIHGKRNQKERLDTLKRFKSGQLKVLVATDVAARGLDIPDVETVYNMEWPREAMEYVHRAGRTARMGKRGLTVSFTSDEEVPLMREAQKLTGREIPAGSLSGEAAAALDLDGSFEKLVAPKHKGDGSTSDGKKKASSKERAGDKRSASRKGKDASRKHRKRNPHKDKGRVKVKRKKRG